MSSFKKNQRLLDEVREFMRLKHYSIHTERTYKVAPSTQNQAMNALVFLYKKVLKIPLTKEINAILAPKKINIPVMNLNFINVR